MDASIQDELPLDVVRFRARKLACEFEDYVDGMRRWELHGSPSTPGHHHDLASRRDLVRSLKLEVPTFAGRADQKTPEQFVRSLIRYAKAQHQSETWVLRELLPVALVGDAERWWSSRGGFETWEEFSHDFHSAFGQPDRKRRLQRELDDRTQHEEEDFSSFVRVIGEFYERLGSPAAEEEKVERVLAQASPSARQVLQGRRFNSMRDLEDFGLEIETLVWRSSTYQPPPRPSASTLETDLAFTPRAKSQRAPAAIVSMPGQQATSQAQPADECNRCHGVGHWARQCPSQPTQTPFYQSTQTPSQQQTPFSQQTRTPFHQPTQTPFNQPTQTPFSQSTPSQRRTSSGYQKQSKNWRQ